MILFTYILKWALCLAVLYIPFALLLRRETFATFHRMLLIGIIAVSCILPAITVTIPVEVRISEAIESFGSGALAVTGRAIGSASDTEKAWNALFSMDTLLALYIAGAAAALLQKAIGAVKVGRAIERGVVWTDREKNMTIHCRADECAPFSWFGHIVISQKDYDECGREILLHEEGHIFCGHIEENTYIGRDVQQETEANDFSYCMQNPTLADKLCYFIKNNKLWLSIVAVVLVACIILFCWFMREERLYGDFVVTETGNKYHQSDCNHIKNKNNVRRLTLEEFESGEYEPCGTCLP